jgi:hypothetical protein
MRVVVVEVVVAVVVVVVVVVVVAVVVVAVVVMVVAVVEFGGEEGVRVHSDTTAARHRVVRRRGADGAERGGNTSEASEQRLHQRSQAAR